MGQPIVFAVVSTKGGVGKTTTAANTGAMFADFGMKVLLVDADIQPALSKYFKIAERAPEGLTAVIMRGGNIQPDCISRLERPNMDIVVSDTVDDTLQAWLATREDRQFILKRAMRSPYVRETYDVVVIDTQGAVGQLQATAATAADILVSPINPTILSAREFASGTMAMLERLNRMADFNADLRTGDLYALIYGMDRTNDSKNIADRIRSDFRGNHKVRVLETVVPSAVSYRMAATMQLPAYEIDRPPSDKEVTAYDTLHELIWELFPNLKDAHFEDVSVSSEE